MFIIAYAMCCICVYLMLYNLPLERFIHLIPVLYFCIQGNKNSTQSMPLSLGKTHLLDERRPNTVFFLLLEKSFVFIFASHTIYIK